MSRFLETLHSGRVLLMDGAMGTELQRAGLPLGEKGESWNLSRPGRVLDIHKAYVASGAQCLLTNTFQAIPSNLVFPDREENTVAKIIKEAIFLARMACGPDGFVLADLGPSLLESSSFDELIANRSFIGVVRTLVEADAILLETCSNPGIRKAIRFIQEVTAGETDREIPVLLSLTYHRSAGGELRTISDDPPEAFAWPELKALGVNCGKEIGMDEIIEIVRSYRQVTDLPLFARPNAGTPTRAGDSWIYPRSPEHLAARLPELLEAGVAMVGGCCGTTPAHIAAMKPIVDQWNSPLGDQPSDPLAHLC